MTLDIHVPKEGNKLSSVLTKYQTRNNELQKQHRKFRVDTGEACKGKVVNYINCWGSLCHRSL